MSHQLIILSLLIAFAYTQPPNRPIIGIVTLPSDFDEYPGDSWSYLSSAYVKFLETGGSQVIPIQYDLPKANLTFLLERLNGVLFTGGSTPIINPDGSYTRTGETLSYIVNYIVEQNKNGTYYPLWGTCLGFQMIACILQKNFSILTPDCVGCNGLSKNIVFNTAYESRTFAHLPADLHEGMLHDDLTPFFHNSMLHVGTFENSVPLNSILTPTTFSYDEVGKEYVSSYEGLTMPIYGTQFHQEVPTFQWREGVVTNHGPKAVRLQQYLSKFFVNETKRNPNTFPEQQQYLIENYNSVVLLDTASTSLYFFPSVNRTGSVEEVSFDDLLILQ